MLRHRMANPCSPEATRREGVRLVALCGSGVSSVDVVRVCWHYQPVIRAVAASSRIAALQLGRKRLPTICGSKTVDSVWDKNIQVLSVAAVAKSPLRTVIVSARRRYPAREPRELRASER